MYDGGVCECDVFCVYVCGGGVSVMSSVCRCVVLVVCVCLMSPVSRCVLVV